jgi:hypothetical protein
MAHFAKLNESSIVTDVIVVADSDAAKKNWAGRMVPNEATGIAFCKALLGADTNWVQTSYSGSIRFRYAGIGYTYDATNDVFYRPNPYASWTLNTSTWDWDAPVALPDDEGYDDEDDPTEYVSYEWDEASTSWVNRTVHPV